MATNTLFPLTGGAAPSATTSAVSTPMVAPVKPAPVAPVAPVSVAPDAPAPIVSTSKLAVQDINNKMAKVNETSAQLQTTAAQKASAPTQPAKSVTIYDAKGNPNSVPEYDLAYWKTQGWSEQAPTTQTGTAPTTGATGPAPTGTEPGAVPTAAPISAYQTETEKNSQKMDAAYEDYKTNVDQIRNGTFPLSPDQQAQIDSITQQFTNLIEQQKLANKNYQGAVTQAGISSGRNRYAPEIELGNVNAAINAGVNQISKLNGEMVSAVTTAKLAFQQQNYDLLDKAYDNLTKTIEARQKAIDSMREASNKALENAREEQRLDLEQRKFDFEIQQEMNKPLIEADKDARDHLYELGRKYSDAGILATDTIEQATEKVRNSALYQADLANTLAQAAAKKSGGEVTDTTIRMFANSLLEQGLAANVFEADQMARDYYASGFVPEGPKAGAASTSILQGAQRLASRNSAAQQSALLRGVNEKIASGDILGATTDVYTNAYASLPTTQQDRAFGYVQGLNDLDEISTLLSEYKAAGGDTGLLSGTSEAIRNKVGKTGDPALLDIANRITLAMSNYRKAQSGAAFTESEEKLYKQAFPSTFGGEQYNATKIKSLRDAFNTGLRSQLQVTLGADTYDSMERLRVAETAKPEMRKAAEKAGYDPGDIDLLIQDGLSKEEIERALSSPKAKAPAIQSVSVGGREVKVDKSIASKLASAAKEFKEKTGKDLQINQHFRTREEQARLYKELSKKGARVAPPGKSFHEKGLAIDVTNWKEAEAILRKYGFRNDLEDDKGHFSVGETYG